MGKSLQELGLQPDELFPTAGEDLEGLPDFGQWAPPPQPGPYRFQLPSDLTSIYEPFEGRDKPAGKATRIRAIFDRDTPLIIRQAVDAADIGQPFQTRLSNDERGRGKDKAIVASDMDYLLRALGQKVKPKNNAGYVEELVKCAGKEFGADLRYSWKCSADRNIRVRNETSGLIEEVENQPGCGSSFYNEDVQNGEDGKKPYEIQCQCGAILRAFANLDNFRP